MMRVKKASQLFSRKEILTGEFTYSHSIVALYFSVIEQWFTSTISRFVTGL